MRTFIDYPSWQELEGFIYARAVYCSACKLWIGIEKSDRDQVITIGERSEMGHKDLVYYTDFKIHCPNCQKEILFTR